MPIDAAISLGQAKKTTAPPTSVTNAACDNMQKRMRESSHFDQPVPFGKEGFDPRQQRLEPIQQGLAARIAHSQPNDDGSAVAALALTILEILVLGDNDRANLLRMSLSQEGRSSSRDFRRGVRRAPKAVELSHSRHRRLQSAFRTPGLKTLRPLEPVLRVWNGSLRPLREVPRAVPRRPAPVSAAPAATGCAQAHSNPPATPGSQSRAAAADCPESRS